jgi:hypothetical protein
LQWRHNVVVTGFPADAADDDLDPEVARLLDELDAAADRWDAKVADGQCDHFEAVYGGVKAVGDRDGRLVSLWLSPDVMSYSYLDLEHRLCTAFASLREAALDAAADPAVKGLL